MFLNHRGHRAAQRKALGFTTEARRVKTGKRKKERGKRGFGFTTESQRAQRFGYRSVWVYSPPLAGGEYKGRGHYLIC